MVLLFACSYPYYASSHTPIFNTGNPNLKHKRKRQKFDLLSQNNNLLLVMKVAYVESELVRVECLCLPLRFSMDSYYMSELSRESFFEGHAWFLFGAKMRVALWNQDRCKIECFCSAAIDEGTVFDEAFVRSHVDDIECVLYMSDVQARVASVKLSCMEARTHERLAPHRPAAAEIHNLCGFCRLPYDITFESFEKIQAKKQWKRNRKVTSDYVLSTNGNFVLCGTNNQVDFRGGRSIALIEKDWKFISGLHMKDVQTFVYMMVMKGNIGKGLILDSHDNFLSSRIKAWSTCIFHYEEVCDVLEIAHLKWSVLKEIYPSLTFSATIQACKSVNMFVSRKGGTIIRVTFGKSEAWDLCKEYAVLNDSNMLLNVLHRELLGK